jgi:FKBP-type peptidyl-prolyl cis-trans isomerase
MTLRAQMGLILFLVVATGAAGCSSPREGQLQPDGTVTPPRDVAAAPADAIRTASGLASKVLRVGLGTARPGPRSRVLMHYTGWTPDGQMVETTLKAQAVTMSLDAVIPGWTEGLQLMVPGEKRRFWVPAHLAQIDKSIAGAPTGPLVFDIELLEIR